jgi:hypothetical protein
MKKSILITISAATIALWSGFALGYHNGVRDGQAKWQSMIDLKSDGHWVLKGPRPIPQQMRPGHINIPPNSVSK